MSAPIPMYMSPLSSPLPVPAACPLANMLSAQHLLGTCKPSRGADRNRTGGGRDSGCRFAWKAEAAQRKTGVPATWAMNASEPDNMRAGSSTGGRR